MTFIWIDCVQAHPLRGEFRRYRLPANGSSASYERVSNETIDLPTVNYKRNNGKDYGYAYGFSDRLDRPIDFPNQLVKVDLPGA